ncbi:MAG: hypothetical protein Q4E53_11070 [Eubacteriales bacterium]|nr:hypothetical protein [Eubacteriales bacterium]
MNELYKIPYFMIGESQGGNQDWCTDFWMYLGGCGALAACDICICLAQNYGESACCPFPVEEISRKHYVDFSMKMKPYIHPRMGGVSKTSLFTQGYGDFLRKCGYHADFMELSGDKSYEEACEFVKQALKKDLPIAYLMLRHKDKSLKDLNWHWFMITGYKMEGEKMKLFYHTYGQENEVDFATLWNTGMYRKGGMVAIRHITPLERTPSISGRMQ